MIGQDLVTQLKNGNEIWTAGRTPVQHAENIHHIDLDLSSEWKMDQLPDQVDVIYHLAQSEHFREFPDKAVEVFHTNTLSTIKLLDYAQKIGVKKFIYGSSGGIYGFGDTGFTEKQEIAARGDLGFYLSTKLCSEILVENYFKYFDVHIIRFFFVYGPQQRKTMLIPRLIDNIKNDRPIALDGPEGIRINPVFVEDAAAALTKCLDLGGSHKINIGGAEVMSLKEICTIIGQRFGKNPVFQINEGSEPKNIHGDIGQMRKLLCEPKTPFTEAVKRFS